MSSIYEQLDLIIASAQEAKAALDDEWELGFRNAVEKMHETTTEVYRAMRDM